MGDLGQWTRGKFSSNGKVPFLNKALTLVFVASAFHVIQNCAVKCIVHKEKRLFLLCV